MAYGTLFINGSAEKRRNHMTVLSMIVVSRTIQISEHDTPVICSVLSVIAFTEHDSRNFCNTVWFICRLVITFYQSFFQHGLCCKFWINTDCPKKKKFISPITISGIDYFCFNHQILIDELCLVRIVYIDTDNLYISEIDLICFLCSEFFLRTACLSVR